MGDPPGLKNHDCLMIFMIFLKIWGPWTKDRRWSAARAQPALHVSVIRPRPRPRPPEAAGGRPEAGRRPAPWLHHHLALPSPGFTITRLRHHPALPSPCFTITRLYHHPVSPSPGFTITMLYHHPALPSPGFTITQLHHHQVGRKNHIATRITKLRQNLMRICKSF